MDTPQPTTTNPAAELRAELARQMVPLYEISPRVGLHPANLGQLLRGRRPLTPEMAERIRAAIAEIAESRLESSVAAA